MNFPQGYWQKYVHKYVNYLEDYPAQEKCASQLTGQLNMTLIILTGPLKLESNQIKKNTQKLKVKMLARPS